jgi:hypothetical protein
MDLDTIFSNLNPENIDSIATIAEIDALCENKDSNTVLIRAFVGGWNPQQAQPFDDALEKLADEDINHVGTLAGDFSAPTAGTMPSSQSVFLDLAETFEESDGVVLVVARLLG